jgi:hypothetical protein
MGRLGWSERDALAADVNSIKLAWEGRREADYDTAMSMYLGAAGVKPVSPFPVEKAKPTASDMREFARAHNARLARSKQVEAARAAAQAAARAKASPKAKTE